MPAFCDHCGTLLTVLEDRVYCDCCKRAFHKDVELAAASYSVSMPGRAMAEQEELAGVRSIVEETCPRCGHGKAYYTTQQMRSADEGQTVFYECCKCGYKYRQNT